MIPAKAGESSAIFASMGSHIPLRLNRLTGFLPGCVRAVVMERSGESWLGNIRTASSGVKGEGAVNGH